jgi:hypothetical protein
MALAFGGIGAELHAVLDRRRQYGDIDDPPEDRLLVEVQVAGEEVSVDGGAAGVPGGQQRAALEDEPVPVGADLKAGEEPLQNVDDHQRLGLAALTASQILQVQICSATCVGAGGSSHDIPFMMRPGRRPWPGPFGRRIHRIILAYRASNLW